MRPQSFGRVVVARQLRLGTRSMDFIVADLMDEDCGASLPTFQFWDQMMQRLARLGRDRPQTKWACGHVVHDVM